MDRRKQAFRRYGRNAGNEKAFTLTELIISAALTVTFTAVILTALIVSKQICNFVTTEQGLQQAATAVLGKIITGGSEPTGTFRLSEATLFDCPGTSGTVLNFTGTDTIVRSYFLNGSSIIYQHPGAGGVLQNEVIYTVPPNLNLTLRFWSVVVGEPRVGIYIGLTRPTTGQDRAVSGSVGTTVNIRNHQP